jgi:hypothetical protein
MSDSGTERLDVDVERPDQVTDPLPWKLALAVADAHEPADGVCRNLGCAGQSWPCAAWNNAQHALRVAQTDPGDAAPAQRPASAAPTAGDPLVGWSTALVPAGRRPQSVPVSSAA